MARFIACDAPHEEQTEWEWQVVRRDGSVNTMLCDDHFAQWVLALLAPDEPPAETAPVVPQGLDGDGDGDDGSDACPWCGLVLPAAEQEAHAGTVHLNELADLAAGHDARTARKLAARKSGAATSEAVVPWPGESGE